MTAKQALDGYAKLQKDVQRWNDEVLGRGIVKTKVKVSKDLIEVETTQFDPDPASRAVRVAILGGETARTAIAVRDGRLFRVQGPNPRELLQKIGTHKSDMVKAPVLAATLASHGDAEGLAYFDVLTLVNASFKGVKDPTGKQVAAMLSAVPGLTELRAPMAFIVRGGATKGIDFQIPFQTFVNVAQVVRPFVGKMGAGP